MKITAVRAPDFADSKHSKLHSSANLFAYFISYFMLRPFFATVQATHGYEASMNMVCIVPYVGEVRWSGLLADGIVASDPDRTSKGRAIFVRPRTYG